MVNELYFEEIMKNVPKSDELYSLGYTLPLIGKYASLTVQGNDKGELHYAVNADELKKSDISNEELIELKSQGWEYDDTKENIILKVNY